MHVVHYSNIVLLQTVRPACMHVYNNVVYIIMVPAVAYFWCASNVDVQVPRGGRTFDWETWTFSCFHTNVTNVTWRRNGIVITPNETYRQTVAQQYAYGYLSTLTIARSVPATDVYGTYSCTFERQHLTLDIVLYRKQICPKHDSIASVSSGRQSPDDRKLFLYLFIGGGLMFEGKSLANNSLVDLENIGITDQLSDASLQCTTNKTDCCHLAYNTVRFGWWYYPNGTEVTNNNFDLYRHRGRSVAYLNRRKGGMGGIYRCKITDRHGVNLTWFVGLYAGQEGNKLSPCSQFVVQIKVGWCPRPGCKVPDLNKIWICMFCFWLGTPSVTSLTFDRESRTLTCTSTGGPATTVTWSRDGVVITLNATYQQTQTIVDTVEGTYETVLTIDTSVSWSNIVGTYNCTVENARGESSGTVVVSGETWTLICSDCSYTV